MARQVATEIEIEASAEVVWEILTDFGAFAEWNDLIRHIEGEREIGSTLRVKIRLGDRRPITVKPRLIGYEVNRELRWRGRLLIPGIFDGEHSFIIEPTSDSTVRFLHRESFSGILVPLIFGSMEAKLVASFSEMNQALKKRAEGRMAALVP